MAANRQRTNSVSEITSLLLQRGDQLAKSLRYDFIGDPVEALNIILQLKLTRNNSYSTKYIEIDNIIQKLESAIGFISPDDEKHLDEAPNLLPSVSYSLFKPDTFEEKVDISQKKGTVIKHPSFTEIFLKKAPQHYDILVSLDIDETILDVANSNHKKYIVLLHAEIIKAKLQFHKNRIMFVATTGRHFDKEQKLPEYLSGFQVIRQLENQCDIEMSRLYFTNGIKKYPTWIYQHKIYLKGLPTRNLIHLDDDYQNYQDCLNKGFTSILVDKNSPLHLNELDVKLQETSRAINSIRRASI